MCTIGGTGISAVKGGEGFKKSRPEICGMATKLLGAGDNGKPDSDQKTAVERVVTRRE